MQIENKKNGIQVKVKLDTGSQVNVITNKFFEKVKSSYSVLVKSKSYLTSYTGEQLKVLGKTKLTCMCHELDFHVTKS